MNNTGHNAHCRHLHGALLHLPGFGPKKIAALRNQNIATWADLLHHHHQDLPGFGDAAPDWVKSIRQCESAANRGDLVLLVNTLHRSDHWRILADYLDRATFLDIETSGDQHQPEITLIVAMHRGQLHIFTAEQNLDRFLDLLDDISLLVTFNGASFDVPQMENHFHIPMRDIAHIDLRWVCYHLALRGGLKEIERAIGLVRPDDLIGMDGAEADWLWRRWKDTGNPKLLQRLTRYCAADVIGLDHLSRWLIARQTGAAHPDFHWRGLPEAEAMATAAGITAVPLPETPTGNRLRDHARSLRAHVRRRR